MFTKVNKATLENKQSILKQRENVIKKCQLINFRLFLLIYYKKGFDSIRLGKLKMNFVSIWGISIKW